MWFERAEEQSRPLGFMVLRPEPWAAGSARRVVGKACAAVEADPEFCATAQLLASELVTNAVLHGRSEVRLQVVLLLGRLRVSVRDENSRHPVRQSEDEDALDGRGLALVDALAERWGVDDLSHGKDVWFELAIAQRSPASCP